MPFKKLTSVIFILTTLLISCHEDFLKGFDRQTLFSAPTQAEISAVRADWAARDLSARGYAVVEETTIPDVGVLKIISFIVSDLKEYAALVIPPNGDNLPVRIFIYGFAIDDNTTYFNAQGTNLPFILAVPAMRGQTLSININNKTYTAPVSDGDRCDAFDGATDDTIALLNVIGKIEPRANTNRVSVRGGSRGATVALLAGLRDPRVSHVVAIAGPSDLLSLTSVSENDDTYQCQFLNGLKSGSETIVEARQKIIASSPLYFAQSLPGTQMHMGADDTIVPVSQGTDLDDKMTALGLANNFELFIYEGREHSNIADNNTELNERIEQFLSDL